jgi:hypothetical protein
MVILRKKTQTECSWHTLKATFQMSSIVAKGDKPTSISVEMYLPYNDHMMFTRISENTSSDFSYICHLILKTKMRGNGIFQQKTECSSCTLMATLETNAVASGDEPTSYCYKTTLPTMTQRNLQEILRIPALTLLYLPFNFEN